MHKSFSGPESGQPHPQSAIAIVGMSCRYPGADTPQAYWDLFERGEPRIGVLPDHRRPSWGSSALLAEQPRGAFLDDIVSFDAGFFGLSDEDAAVMDPQARIFLETAWHALESSGYAGARCKDLLAGVWVGYGFDHHGEAPMRPAGTSRIGSSTTLAAKWSSFADWHGPSVVVNALCASSIVAIHEACNSLRLHQCDLALAASVSAALGPEYFEDMRSQGSLSTSGHSRPFDERADGFVPGEGAGALVLKRLADAQRDGDGILGIIRGSATSHSGRSAAVFSMNLEAQASLLDGLLECSGAHPNDVGCVLAHAVGTRLGDAVEFAAIERVFSQHAAGRGTAVATAKALVGHLEAASGMASVQKALLALQRRTLPACPVAQPNAMLRLDRSSLRFLPKSQNWPLGERPRLAAATAFSSHGVNAAILLEEPPERAARFLAVSDLPHMLVLSAQRLPALRELVRRWRAALDEVSDVQAACVAAALGRAEKAYRVAFHARDSKDLQAVMDSWLCSEIPSVSPAAARPPRWTLTFTAHGDELADHAARARAELSVLRRELARREVEELFEHSSINALDESGDRVAILARDCARARLWRACGLVPAAVYGDGQGLAAAACVSGALSFDEAASALMRRMPALDSLGRFQRPTSRAVAHESLEVLLGHTTEFAGAAADQLAWPGSSDDACGARGVAALWRSGVAVDWSTWFIGGAPAEEALPLYPFRLSPAPADAAAVASPNVASAPLIARANRPAVALVSDAIRRAAPHLPELAGSANLLASGMDSAAMTSTVHLLARTLGEELSPILLFEHASIDALAAYLELAFPNAPPLATALAESAIRNEPHDDAGFDRRLAALESKLDSLERRLS